MVRGILIAVDVVGEGVSIDFGAAGLSPVQKVDDDSIRRLFLSFHESVCVCEMLRCFVNIDSSRPSAQDLQSGETDH